MLESLLLVLALSLDAFVASIAYGTNKIKIPCISVLIIDVICSTFLGISIILGSMVKTMVPREILVLISFTILMVLGVYYLFEGIVKSYIGRRDHSSKRMKLKLFNFKVIIEIYMDETKADFDSSKTLSPKEALYLATALSLDSIAVGFGSSIWNINYLQVILLSLVFNALALWIGLLLGRKLAIKSKIDLSWLAGIILIVLAVLKLI